MSSKETLIRFGKRTALIAFGFGLGAVGTSGMIDATRDVNKAENLQTTADLQGIVFGLVTAGGMISLGSGIIYKNPRLQELLSKKKNVEDQPHSQNDSGN